MKGLPVVYPIFSLPHFPDRICPRMYKYYLYNALLFLEDTEIIVCSNSNSIRQFIETIPPWLKRNLFYEYFSPGKRAFSFATFMTCLP